mgnify:FL=1
MSINQINLMHRHLMGTQPTTNLTNPMMQTAKQLQTSTGNLARRSSANFCRPVRQHVLHSWVQLSKLLRKILSTLEKVLPRPTELIMFDEPDQLTKVLEHIFVVAYNQLVFVMHELTKFSKATTSSPSRSASTNESS